MVGGDAGRRRTASSRSSPRWRPRTATPTSARSAPATSRRWSTTASSTGCCRPTPRASPCWTRPTEFELDLHQIAAVWQPRLGRAVVAARPGRAGARRQGGLRRDQGLRRGLGRGPLDGRGGDRPRRARCRRSPPRCSPASRPARTNAFSARIVAALRNQFGGHQFFTEAKAAEQEKDRRVRRARPRGSSPRRPRPQITAPDDGLAPNPLAGGARRRAPRAAVRPRRLRSVGRPHLAQAAARPSSGWPRGACCRRPSPSSASPAPRWSDDDFRAQCLEAAKERGPEWTTLVAQLPLRRRRLQRARDLRPPAGGARRDRRRPRHRREPGPLLRHRAPGVRRRWPRRSRPHGLAKRTPDGRTRSCAS